MCLKSSSHLAQARALPLLQLMRDSLQVARVPDNVVVWRVGGVVLELFYGMLELLRALVAPEAADEILEGFCAIFDALDACFVSRVFAEVRRDGCLQRHTLVCGRHYVGRLLPCSLSWLFVFVAGVVCEVNAALFHSGFYAFGVWRWRLRHGSRRRATARRSRFTLERRIRRSVWRIWRRGWRGIWRKAWRTVWRRVGRRLSG